MKRLVIEIDEALHKAVRSAAFGQEKSMKQYVTDLLKEATVERSVNDGKVDTN
ncbi:MAG: hypothetical protein K2N34_07935 [Lachnospiraceae bacterium]|nr:hypothetical protein [Lachnospiraceae bacterium]